MLIASGSLKRLKQRVLEVGNSGLYRDFVDAQEPGSGGSAKPQYGQNARICCGFFQTGNLAPDKSQCSGFLFNLE